MKALFLVWADDHLVEVSTFSRLGGANLNATARELIEDIRDETDGRNYSCSIYLTVGRRLAFVGEEVIEGEKE